MAKKSATINTISTKNGSGSGSKGKKTEKTEKKTKKTIVFLHPDLGIGGAERLVVDAAVGLQNRGNKVVIFTSHCDPQHCFDEARDGTLDVRVRGNTLIPPSILGRFSILCAILRQLHLLVQVSFPAFSSYYATSGSDSNSDSESELRALRPDAYFVDQLSAGLPLLRLLLDPGARVFFYCHYPDLLLARGRDRWWKRAYRLPFDALERWSMGFADAIAVNSNFTRSVVARTWPGLAMRRELLTVYPCVDTRIPATTVNEVEGREGMKKKKKKKKKGEEGEEEEEEEEGDEKPLWDGKPFLLSINRFERKKDVALAIRAFAALSPEQRQSAAGKARLVIAGGYDSRVAENVSYRRELEALAASLGLSSRTARTAAATTGAAAAALSEIPGDVDVAFLLSVPGALKHRLLRDARLLVYTPAGEHFGIVPLEAMLRGCPVLAADSGGPVETVVEGATGWLRDPADPPRWAEVMDLVLNRLAPRELAAMRRAGAERVAGAFGQDRMAETLDGIFDALLEKGDREPGRGRGRGGVVVVVVALGAVLAAVVAVAVAARLVPRFSLLLGKGDSVVWAEA